MTANMFYLAHGFETKKMVSFHLDSGSGSMYFVSLIPIDALLFFTHERKKH